MKDLHQEDHKDTLLQVYFNNQIEFNFGSFLFKNNLSSIKKIAKLCSFIMQLM